MLGSRGDVLRVRQVETGKSERGTVDVQIVDRLVDEDVVDVHRCRLEEAGGVDSREREGNAGERGDSRVTGDRAGSDSQSMERLLEEDGRTGEDDRVGSANRALDLTGSTLNLQNGHRRAGRLAHVELVRVVQGECGLGRLRRLRAVEHGDLLAGLEAGRGITQGVGVAGNRHLLTNATLVRSHLLRHDARVHVERVSVGRVRINGRGRDVELVLHEETVTGVIGEVHIIRNRVTSRVRVTRGIDVARRDKSPLIRRTDLSRFTRRLIDKIIRIIITIERVDRSQSRRRGSERICLQVKEGVPKELTHVTNGEADSAVPLQVTSRLANLKILRRHGHVGLISVTRNNSVRGLDIGNSGQSPNTNSALSSAAESDVVNILKETSLHHNQGVKVAGIVGQDKRTEERHT